MFQRFLWALTDAGEDDGPDTVAEGMYGLLIERVQGDEGGGRIGGGVVGGGLNGGRGILIPAFTMTKKALEDG